MTQQEQSDPDPIGSVSKRDYLRLLLAAMGVGALSTSTTEVAKAAHLTDAPYPNGAWGYSPIAGNGVSERPSIAEINEAWSETYHHLFQDVKVGARYYAEKNDDVWDLLPIVWDSLDTPIDTELPAGGMKIEDDGTQFRLVNLNAAADAKNVATVAYTTEPLQPTTITWTTAADWDAAQSETGIHHEQPNGTDWAASDVLEKGYPSFDESNGSLRNYYPNDNNTGTTSTDVAGTDDGTVQGASWNTSGILNTPYLSFDGADDYLDLGTMGTYGSNFIPITISCWIRTTSTDQETIIGEIEDGFNTAFWLTINSNESGNNVDGKIEWTIRDDDNEADRYATTNATNINDGSWHHVAVTYNEAGNNSEAQLYLDGTALAMTAGNTSAIDNLSDFSYSVTIGGRNSRGTVGEHYTGDIDEFRLYQRVLTDSQVTDLYNGVENQSEYWTSKKTGIGIESTITVTTTSTIPSGTSIDLHLFEDVGNDDTGTGTDALGNNYDNTDSANLTPGNDQTVDLTGFDGDASTNAYWLHLEPDITNNDPTTDSPTIGEVSIDV